MADRLVETLCEFVRIPSESGQEEDFLAHMSGLLEKEFGAVCRRDSYGNLVAGIPARRSGRRSTLLIGMHSDTVAPGTGIRPIVDGGIIRSDGTTVLGADDKAGIAELVEALRRAERFPPLEVVLTREEERGLLGSQHLDFSLVTARQGYVLDMDTVDSVVLGGPTKVNLDVEILGRSAHAGMEPEKGISAIRAAALAIGSVPDGRIDAETTCNVGTIRGGENRNSVPERVNLQIEVRSLDHEKCVALAERIRKTFEETAASMGASAAVTVYTAYRAASISEDAEVVRAAAAAIKAAGLTPRISMIVGGTDASAYNEHGIQCAVLGIGVQQEHTKREQVSIVDMERAVDILTRIFRQFAED